MTRDRARRASRITGHIAWWVYVIAAVFGLCIADRYGSTMPRRYADYLTTDIGWTAYTPLEDFTPSGAGSSSTAFFGGLALVAGAVVLVAAVAEAVVGGRWGSGIVTVAAPAVGGALVSMASCGGIGDVLLSPELLFALVLAGVAIREIWSRALAPTRRSAPEPGDG